MGKTKDILVINGETYQRVPKETHIHFILDESYSMNPTREATISGFNEYIGGLKNDGNRYVMTLVTFASNPCTIYANKPIKSVPDLNVDSYQATGSSTALYDAVCETLEEASSVPGKNLVVIMTDGEENSSHKHTEKDLSKLRKELEATCRWTFVFLGANQDAFAKAQQLGFSVQNVSNYNQTERGARVVFNNLARSTGLYAASAAMSTGAFYTAAQQKNMEETK